MKKKAPWIIGACVAAALWWLVHTPEIQWYDAKSYVGKRVTVIGPIIRGNLDAPDGLVTMTMGAGLSDNDWESSLHILVPRKNLSSGWTQKDLERGAVMKWTGLVQTGLVNSTWLIVEPIGD
jgi:hypothetical protein